MPRMMGEALGRGPLALLGEAVDANVRKSGVIWKAVEDAELQDEAEKLTAHAGRRSRPEALALMKRS